MNFGRKTLASRLNTHRLAYAKAHGDKLVDGLILIIMIGRIDGYRASDYHYIIREVTPYDVLTST